MFIFLYSLSKCDVVTQCSLYPFSMGEVILICLLQIKQDILSLVPKAIRIVSANGYLIAVNIYFSAIMGSSVCCFMMSIIWWFIYYVLLAWAGEGVEDIQVAVYRGKLHILEWSGQGFIENKALMSEWDFVCATLALALLHS